MTTLPVFVILECAQCPMSERIPGIGQKTKTHYCLATCGHAGSRRKARRVDGYASPPEWCPLRMTAEQFAAKTNA